MMTVFTCFCSLWLCTCLVSLSNEEIEAISFALMNLPVDELDLSCCRINGDQAFQIAKALVMHRRFVVCLLFVVCCLLFVVCLLFVCLFVYLFVYLLFDWGNRKWNFTIFMEKLSGASRGGLLIETKTRPLTKEGN